MMMSQPKRAERTNRSPESSTTTMVDAGREIFCIPFRKRFIVYAPLKRIAFLANRPMVGLIAKLLAGSATRSSASDAEAVEFVSRIRLLAPQRVSVGSPCAAEYEPVSAVLFLTNRCSLRCSYCYASSNERAATDLPLVKARQAINIVAENAARRKQSFFGLSFHGGGEPTLSWGVLERSVRHARRKSIRARISVSTNGYLRARERDFICEQFDELSLSIDGPPAIQNRQRPTRSGKPSFTRVAKTIQALDRRGLPYGIRVTVTPASVRQLALSVRFLLEHTSARQIQVEPAFPQGRGRRHVLTGGEMAEFVRQFEQAFDIAVAHHRELVYSGARLNAITSCFCRAAREALVVLPTGEVSACFEIFGREHPLAEHFLFGKINGAGLEFDRERWQRIANRTADRISFCQDCFCRWHCAGDCLGKTFAPTRPDHFAPTARCRANQELTKYLLLRRIAESGGIWLGSDRRTGKGETS
jgi:uncharacterized protein